MKSDNTKEKITQETIKLIKEMDGNVDKVTIRKIAERSGVGVGLINHYFGTKENLIENCVQSIIGDVIYTFRIDCEKKSPLETTKFVARQVIDYLIENHQISRISILGDLRMPKYKDNSMNTVYDFAFCMSGKKQPDLTHLQMAFNLVAILQASFLRKDVLGRAIGIEFRSKKERDDYIDIIVEMVMGGEK